MAAVSNEQSAVVDDPPCLEQVYVLVEPALLQHIQETPAAHGAGGAAWIRQAMREIICDDFKPGWRPGETACRSHESGYFRRKFGLRLVCQAKVVREIIAETTPADSSTGLANADSRERAD
jgi:hypothetical protein